MIISLCKDIDFFIKIVVILWSQCESEFSYEKDDSPIKNLSNVTLASHMLSHKIPTKGITFFLFFIIFSHISFKS